MALDRRRLLVGVAAGLAASKLAPAATLAPQEGESPLTMPSGEVDWRAVRALFDLDPRIIHLTTFYLVSHPRPVRAAIDEYRRKLDADPMWLEEAFLFPGDEAARVKSTMAEYLGGKPEEIAWMPNTTTGLALLYNGLKIRRDQEILTTEHDHYVHHESIRLACEKNGASTRRVALYDRGEDANAGEIVARLRRAIGPKTRAVGVTWVHSSTGVKLPISAIAEAVAAANTGRADADRCLLVVDGVHGFGVDNVDAARMGADFFAAGCHKWLFAPRGTGILWGRADAWPHLRPTVPTFDTYGGIEPFEAWMRDETPPPTRAAHVSPGGFLAYEHLFAMAAAVRLHEGIGRPHVEARIHELNGQMREELARMPHVALHTPRDSELAAGIVCFEVAGEEPEQTVRRLHERRISASTSPYAVSYTRLAAGIMIQPEEIEAAMRAVRELAKAA